MKIYLGADHAGFELKEKIKKFLTDQKYDLEDLGNTVFDKDDDYPDFSAKVANEVVLTPNSLGILFCGSAQGACIAANKIKGIRAASVRSEAEAKLARQHDDVNILCLAGGQQVQQQYKNIGLSPALAKRIVLAWLKSSFSQAARHQRRINKIKRIEQKNFW
ncbi:MAG: RpiB/LacA/LacB family sugar-phosphate isomerase [Patescibacteria group bacterium]|jgi:ribose 5-phosphate isomerase B|nr:RpiB/LacA/LacB family sugar-phosphate isomerase [Patescibacteria group bacterium]